MKVGIGQINPVVGDIRGNTSTIIEYCQRAESQGADLVIFPELAVFGYPAKDLLLRESMIAANVAAVEEIASATGNITSIFGFVQPIQGQSGKGIFNAAAVCRAGKVLTTYAKRLLPTYDVFDEARYFSPGEKPCIVRVPTAHGEVALGITICEDIWNDAQFGGRPVYGVDPIEDTVQAGAEYLINIGASPFVAGKQYFRESVFGPQIQRHDIDLVSVNQVGGNDDLLFDGASFALDRKGKLIAQAPAFEDSLWVFDRNDNNESQIHAYPNKIESIRAGLNLGVRDYLRKCGFENVLVGLSGGIDSAVTAAIAADALGPSRVLGVAMPSRYSSDHSLADADALATNLGIAYEVIPIESVHGAMEEVLAPHFAGSTPGLAEENIQARIRGNILMALSNKFGSLLLTTGNKSELAVGYCTLYGDMCGGLSVICDVPKTLVYELATHINERTGRELIPQRTIDKPPSAELRPGQCDQDSLPPYDVLDAILEKYVEEDQNGAAIVAAGFDPDVVASVLSKVDRSEYKRQQAAIGLKVTSRAFGSGRRMPIAAKLS